MVDKYITYELSYEGGTRADHALVIIDIGFESVAGPLDAIDDIFNVALDSRIQNLNVLANDIYTGVPLLEIVSDSGGIGAASVVIVGGIPHIAIPTGGCHPTTRAYSVLAGRQPSQRPAIGVGLCGGRGRGR